MLENSRTISVNSGSSPKINRNIKTGTGSRSESGLESFMTTHLSVRTSSAATNLVSDTTTRDTDARHLKDRVTGQGLPRGLPGVGLAILYYIKDVLGLFSS